MKKTPLSPETLEARLAFKITGELSRASLELPHDICERLRVARQSAVQQRRPELAPQPSVASALHRSGSSVILGSNSWFQNRTHWLIYMVALLTLVGGLLFVQHIHLQSQVSAAAELDADLLADDLPPDAYSDAAFLEFLKGSP
ncbi:MAG: DUF3619 family protein [Burkholderiales bacterium]|jgi:hypothetical protein